MDKLPFPANWSEELVCEYLELEDYFVRTNNPVDGARREMDVIGVKVEQGKLKVIHVEIGMPPSFKSNEINSKFDEECKKEITKIAESFGFENNYDLECWYVHARSEYKGQGKTWARKKEELEREKIKLITFDEMLKEIVTSIKRWQEAHKRKSGTGISLPKNFWLLKVLESLILDGKLLLFFCF